MDIRCAYFTVAIPLMSAGLAYRNSWRSAFDICVIRTNMTSELKEKSGVPSGQEF